MIPTFINRSQVPHKPGVYLYKDKSGRVIYVGKAIDLYHRVASYFSGSHSGGGGIKTAALVEEIRSVETIIVESELEALILEANLIKKYLPQFNVRLTDDKDYLYIKVTKEDFPKIITARKKDVKGSLKYFGPFPSSTTVKTTLKLLRRVFPWCSSTGYRKVSFLDSYYTTEGGGTIAKTRTRPCFYYHLGLCPGACAGEISQEDYRKIIKRFIKFMEGKQLELVDELVKEMQQASGQQNFEEAARIKKTLTGIFYLTQTNRAQVYLENPNFLEDQRQIALAELQKALHLPNLPERIEGYDISNIQGREATGSMVVFTNGEIDKSQYRKFKIKISGRPNDVEMHKEMMRRRLKNDWPLPNLIIVDGGRGQVRGAQLEIKNLKLEIPLYGLAKRMEWLYPPKGEIVKLPKSHPGLKLLQKLRDESHRFAITYHRKLHGKMLINEIPAKIFPH